MSNFLNTKSNVKKNLQKSLNVGIMQFDIEII